MVFSTGRLALVTSCLTLIVTTAFPQADETSPPPKWVSGLIARLEARIAEADASIEKDKAIIERTSFFLNRVRAQKNDKAQGIAEKALETVMAAQRSAERSKRRASVTLLNLKRLVDTWGDCQGQNATIYRVGKVEIQRQGQKEWSSLETDRSQFLRPGDQIRTGEDGGARFLMADGASIEVDRNSSVEIEAPNRLGLTAGIMRSEVKLLLAGKFEVRTLSAVTSVRGTEYVVQVRDNQDTEVTVFEGSVWVKTPAGEGEIVVEAGHRLLVPRGKTPAAPEEVDLRKLHRWWEE